LGALEIGRIGFLGEAEGEGAKGEAGLAKEEGPGKSSQGTVPLLAFDLLLGLELEPAAPGARGEGRAA